MMYRPVVALALPTRALSLRQPWAHAVVHGGKRIENRTAWSNSSFRGPLLIHAAQGMTQDEFHGALHFADDRARREKHIDPSFVSPWRPPTTWFIATRGATPIARGGIVGMCNVIAAFDAIRYVGPIPPWLEEQKRLWWMGSFALVLDDVRTLPFTACKGALGFFTVPDDVLAKLRA